MKTQRSDAPMRRAMKGLREALVRSGPLLLVAGCVAIVIACPAPAEAATSGSTPIGQVLNVVNGWRNDLQLWLPVACAIGYAGTAIMLILEGFRINAALVTFGGLAVASTVILAGPAFITAIATLLGYSGAVI